MTASGRGVWRRKKRVEEVRAIDMLDLQREGVFKNRAGVNWTSSWSTNGAVVASVSYRVEVDGGKPRGLRFMYSITNNNSGKKQDYSYVVEVTSTPCNYGGERWWFICPLIVDGRACRRRCRIIYLPPGSEYFGCRECHQLSYESRQRHREKFFEEFEKPRRIAESAQEQLARVRSWEKKEKLWFQFARASARIERYADFITSRMPKISYKEKK
jgi:hypothetical protein